MKPEVRETWIKRSLAVLASLVAIGCLAYLAQGSRANVPDPPAGSRYYKGWMAADEESAKRDPLRKKDHPAGSPPAGVAK